MIWEISSSMISQLGIPPWNIPYSTVKTWFPLQVFPTKPIQWNKNCPSLSINLSIFIHHTLAYWGISLGIIQLSLWPGKPGWSALLLRQHRQGVPVRIVQEHQDAVLGGPRSKRLKYITPQGEIQKMMGKTYFKKNIQHIIWMDMEYMDRYRIYGYIFFKYINICICGIYGYMDSIIIAISTIVVGTMWENVSTH